MSNKKRWRCLIESRIVFDSLSKIFVVKQRYFVFLNFTFSLILLAIVLEGGGRENEGFFLKLIEHFNK